MWNTRPVPLIVFLLIFAFGNSEMVKGSCTEERSTKNELFILYARLIKDEFTNEIKKYKSIKTEQFFSTGASFLPLAKSITINLDMQPEYKWYYRGDRHFFLSDQELKQMLLKVVEELRIDYSIYFSRRDFLQARARNLNIKDEIAKDTIDTYIPPFKDLYIFIFVKDRPLATFKNNTLRLNGER